MENWDPIKEQWVACYKDNVFNLGETTNNRLENMNAKIKSVCSRYASMLQFFTEMFSVLGAFRKDRVYQQIMALSTKPANLKSCDNDVKGGPFIGSLCHRNP